MESWRLVWRDGIAPLLTTEALAALATGLRADDPRLMQGSTCTPPPLVSVADWPLEAACPIGYAGWQSGMCATVGGCNEFFGSVLIHADRVLPEPGATRWFLNWVDETPRDEMRRELLAEVERALAERASAGKAVVA